MLLRINKSTKLSNIKFYNKLVHILDKNFLNQCEQMNETSSYIINLRNSLHQIASCSGRCSLKIIFEIIITDIQKQCFTLRESFLRVFGSLYLINIYTIYFANAETFLQISLVYSLHFAVPPRSPVKNLPSLMVS